MGFKENLKSELVYSGMLVKELAAKSGVSKYSIDNYLNKRGQSPSVEAAVKIAQTLGVSVEYLVTGKEGKNTKTKPPLSLCPNRTHDLRLLIDTADKLSPKNRRLAIKLIKTLAQETEGK